MRKQLFTFAVAIMALLFTTGLQAQLNTPAPSPSMKVETKIGLTDFHATYSRPGKKGRDLFTAKGIVPTGEVWRTGANQATKFTFGDDVMIMGNDVPAGDYAILTKPNGAKWEDTMDGADVIFVWGNTMATMPVKTNAKKDVMAQIERVMAGPGMNDYYQAASFLAEEDGMEEKALEYIKKANKMAGDSPRFWMVRRQGLIQESLGMKTEAMASFKQSMQLAEKAGNMDYVRMNKKSLGM